MKTFKKYARSRLLSFDPHNPPCLPFFVFKHPSPCHQGTFVLARTHPLSLNFYTSTVITILLGCFHNCQLKMNKFIQQIIFKFVWCVLSVIVCPQYFNLLLEFSTMNFVLLNFSKTWFFKDFTSMYN